MGASGASKGTIPYQTLTWSNKQIPDELVLLGLNCLLAKGYFCFFIYRDTVQGKRILPDASKLEHPDL